MFGLRLRGEQGLHFSQATGNNGPTRFFPASRCSLRDGAGAEEEGACADAMAPQLPPAQPGPNLGEISPSPDRRRPPLIRSSPGKGARDLATGSGAGVGIGGFGMRAAQLPNPARPPERLGLRRLPCCYLFLVRRRGVRPVWVPAVASSRSVAGGSQHGGVFGFRWLLVMGRSIGATVYGVPRGSIFELSEKCSDPKHFLLCKRYPHGFRHVTM